MESLEGKRIIIAYSDPGGAKLMLALASRLKANNIIEIISNRTFDFLSEFDLESTTISEQAIPEMISGFKPDLIITGTSYTNDFELIVIRQAQQNLIPVHSHVDNWQGFSVRFRRNNELIIPDKIFVIDANAKSNCIKEGIPEEIIFIGGHPYWDFLKTWKPKKSKEFVFQHYGLDPLKPLILFAPDPLSNVGGIEKYGFDENSVLQNIFSAEDYANANIVLKAHPNQNPGILSDAIHRNDIQLITDNLYHNHLIFYSDLVISMFSNILIEAQLMGKKAIRYIEGLTTDDIIMDQSIELYKPGLPLSNYYGS